MVQRVEDLRLDRIEEVELVLVELFESLVTESLNRDRPKVEKARVWIILVWYLDLREHYVVLEAQIVPSIADQINGVVFVLTDMVLTFGNVVRYEEC